VGGTGDIFVPVHFCEIPVCDMIHLSGYLREERWIVVFYSCLKREKHRLNKNTDSLFEIPLVMENIFKRL